jgi:urease accessory protein
MMAVDRRRVRWAPLALALALTPTFADAHSPIQGLGTFYNYFLHPFVVPVHAMLLIASALMLGQQGRAGARTGLPALAVGVLCGEIASRWLTPDGAPLSALLVGSLVVGGAVVLDRKLPVALSALMGALVGVAVGLDSSTDVLAFPERIMAFTGLSAGVVYLALVISGLTVGAARGWQRVGVRIVGSWIVAASILVLALSLASHAKRPPAAAGIRARVAQC